MMYGHLRKEISMIRILAILAFCLSFVACPPDNGDPKPGPKTDQIDVKEPAADKAEKEVAKEEKKEEKAAEKEDKADKE
jgi:hypothetical protein